MRIYDGRQAVREPRRGVINEGDKNNKGGKADLLASSEGMNSEVIVAKLQNLFSDNRVEDEEDKGESGEGHIHYLRNSDDDVPDSDEDLDDDLDI